MQSIRIQKHFSVVTKEIEKGNAALNLKNKKNDRNFSVREVL